MDIWTTGGGKEGKKYLNLKRTDFRSPSTSALKGPVNENVEIRRVLCVFCLRVFGVANGFLAVIVIL